MFSLFINICFYIAKKLLLLSGMASDTAPYSILFLISMFGHLFAQPTPVESFVLTIWELGATFSFEQRQRQCYVSDSFNNILAKLNTNQEVIKNLCYVLS